MFAARKIEGYLPTTPVPDASCLSCIKKMRKRSSRPNRNLSKARTFYTTLPVHESAVVAYMML